jgi:hypothetical protein
MVHITISTPYMVHITILTPYMVHIVPLTLHIVHQHLKQSFMWTKIASFIENHILYWSTSRPKYHDKEEMEKPYPYIMFKNKEYISCQ